MTPRRSRVVVAAFAGAMLAAMACGKARTTAAAAPVAKKRAGPEPVAPVMPGTIRFEAPVDGKARGQGQNGGFVVAHDAATVAELWSALLYTTVYAANMEPDKRDVFIVEMKASPDGRALLVTDERGRRWSVDLASHAVVADTAP